MNNLSLFSQDEMLKVADPDNPVALIDRWIVPPFSILDARQGYWQDRKKYWLSLGIRGELGRGEGIPPGDSQEITEPGLNFYRNKNKLSPGGSPRPACDNRKQERGDGRGKALARCYGQDLMKGENPNFPRKELPSDRGYVTAKYNEKLDETTQSPLGCYGAFGGNTIERDQNSSPTGTSIFDPVLCEVIYEWFCPKRGHVLDPFAGGSVRGIVANETGREYTGIDLSERQIIENRKQADEICKDHKPLWLVGDSKNVAELTQNQEFDLIFSCPPYYDLEVYSDDQNDLSVMTWDEFQISYLEIIIKSLALLKNNRFACFVIGDIRDKKGFYRNLVSYTINCFEEGQAILYNEIILVTAVGSLPIRINQQFAAGRKIGKTHQNVLVFYKGDPKNIKDIYGESILG